MLAASREINHLLKSQFRFRSPLFPIRTQNKKDRLQQRQLYCHKLNVRVVWGSRLLSCLISGRWEWVRDITESVSHGRKQLHCWALLSQENLFRLSCCLSWFEFSSHKYITMNVKANVATSGKPLRWWNNYYRFSWAVLIWVWNLLVGISNTL